MQNLKTNPRRSWTIKGDQFGRVHFEKWTLLSEQNSTQFKKIISLIPNTIH